MKKEIQIEIPSVPNFIKVAGELVSEVVVDISDFTDEELKEMGNEWTENLLENARKRRLNKSK